MVGSVALSAETCSSSVCFQGGIGQNQNYLFSCKKNNNQEVKHFLKHEMVFF